MPLEERVLDQRSVDFTRHSISTLASVSTLCRLLEPAAVLKNARCYVDDGCSTESLYCFNSGGKLIEEGSRTSFERIVSELLTKGQSLPVPTLLLVELYGTAEKPRGSRPDLLVCYENELYWRTTLGTNTVDDGIESLRWASTQDGIIGVLVDGSEAKQELAEKNLKLRSLQALVRTVRCVLVCAYDDETYLLCDAEAVK